MTIKTTLFSVLILFLGSRANPVMAQNKVTGVVIDTSGEPLIGANVTINGTTTGATTDLNGQFNFTTDRSFPIKLNISYVGYESQMVTVTNSQRFMVSMKESSFMADEIIISASRRAEKLQEAPAAVSVISTEEVGNSGGVISPIRALINTPGVELQQQTGQRINLALRGSSGVFSTDVFPMLDYRSLITPGLELFDSQNSPLNNIDIERIEVVLGPGSALYGPDVTSGVVHFISKDPFRYPGTTVEMVYGERNTFKTAVRHAGHSENEKFGYKLNARYNSGQDFTLDPDDPDDQVVLSNFQETVRRGFVTEEGFVDPLIEGPLLLTPGKVQEKDYTAAAVTGTLYFRPQEETEIVTSGGWNQGSAIFYNDLGEGFTTSNEYWGQVRLTHKGFFAQTYYITNDGGSDSNPVYLNRTGLIVPLERGHFEAQAQYNFDMPSLMNAEWTVGVDFRNATANTENHVYGRNESDDDYRILGGYAQAKFKPSPKLDMFLAGRYDTYNFTDQTTFSPRAAFVYKPNDKHNIRLTFNQAANPIPASDIYFDLPVQTTPLFHVWNMGGIRDQTFGDDPIIDWVIPGLPVPNTPMSAGFPLDAAYQAVNNDVIAGVQALGSQDPNLAPLVPALVQLLQNSLPGGFSNSLVTTDLNGKELLPDDVSTVLISQTTAYEFGYKGLFGDKFSAGFDVYYFRKTAGGGFGQISPLVTLTNLPTDLGNQVQASYQPQIEQLLLQSGFDAATAGAVAGQIGGLLNGAYAQGGQGFIDFLASQGLPFQGIIPTEQVPVTGFPHLAYGYATRNPDAISDDWGFEVHSKYFFTDVLNTFLNYTWFNRPTGMAGDLNFPQNKIRWGMGYTPEQGVYANVAYQWNQAYTSNNSTFPGEIEALSLVDAGVGYKWESGLNLGLSATNLLDNEFRALPGFPKIGRTMLARVTFDF